jgi:two-component system, chemotaxis family, protein-glutamate methylesterase/glutaminase
MSIRVLIVDDSALIRQLLSEALSREADIDVVGTAPDPYIAREKIKALHPDVLTLDIEMPRMDGLTFLERLMALHPMPVILVSTLTTAGADASLEALRLGAVDCVAKPRADIRNGIATLQQQLTTAIRTAAAARINAGRKRAQRLLKPSHRSINAEVVAIGASTGGVEALHTLLTALPPETPPILITQHMPPGFTASFAKRLDKDCALSVTEAHDGALLKPGCAYIAPGNIHLELARGWPGPVCRLRDTDPVSGHRPSVDVLFRSVAENIGERAVGVILTGMGRDGADGLLAMRRAGAHTIGQDETSCVVYGMPAAAKRVGAVEIEAPLSQVPQKILDAAFIASRSDA